MHHLYVRIGVGAIIAVAALVWHPRWSQSCGPEPNYELYHVSYLEPDILTDSLYRSYYQLLFQQLTDTRFYYGGNYSDEVANPATPPPVVDENIGEWAAHTGAGIPPAHISDAVYTAKGPTLQKALDAVQAGREPAVDSATAANAFLKHLIKTRDTQTLRYLVYAKSCEPLALGQDPWAPNPAAFTPKDYKDALERGLSLRKECTDGFLRARYAFQCVRMAHYGKDYKRAVTLYDQLLASDKDAGHVIRLRALGHKAGALVRMDSVSKGLYLFSQTFDQSQERRQPALREFTRATNDQWNGAMALARNDHERATLWTIRGLADDKLWLEPLQNVYRLEPASPRTSALMMYQVQQAEQNIYAVAATKPAKAPAQYKRDKWFAPMSALDEVKQRFEGRPMPQASYLGALRDFVTRAADRGVVSPPALWQIAAGYLALMSNDFAGSLDRLTLAENAAGGTAETANQIRILKMLARLKSGGQVDPALADALPADLKWLSDKGKKNTHHKYNAVLTAMGQNYLKNNDLPRAAMCFNAAGHATSCNALLDMVATTQELKTLDELVTGGGTSPTDKSLVSAFGLTHNDMLDVRAARLMRSGDFSGARDLLKGYAPAAKAKDTADGPEWQIGFDPAWGPPQITGSEAQRGSGTGAGSRIVSRAEFAQQITALQELAARTPAKADSCYLKIANALAATPFWGYNGLLWKGGLLFSLRYYFDIGGYPLNIPEVVERTFRAQTVFMSEYGANTLAKDYYRKARQATRNPELAAYCCYLLDDCDLNPLTSLHPRLMLKKATENFQILKTQYRTTGFYKSITSICERYGKWARR